MGYLGNLSGEGGGAAIPLAAVYPYIQSTLINDANPLELSYFPIVDILAVPSFGTGKVRLYNPTTEEDLGTITLSSAVNAFHIPSINEIWVSVLSASTISRFNDSAPFALLGTFSNGGNRATKGVIDPVSGYMYWTNLGSNSISVVNPATLAVVTTFASGTIGGTLPKGIHYNNNADSAMYRMIVACISGTNELCIINPATNTVTAANLNPSSSLNNPNNISYCESTNRYYVACSGNNRVVVLEPTSATTFTVDTIIEGVINAYSIDIDQSTNLAYVANGQTSGGSNAPNPVLVSIIDCTTNKIVKVCNTASFNTTSTTVYNVALDTNNGFVFCNGYGGGASASFTSKLKIKP